MPTPTCSPRAPHSSACGPGARAIASPPDDRSRPSGSAEPSGTPASYSPTKWQKPDSPLRLTTIAPTKPGSPRALQCSTVVVSAPEVRGGPVPAGRSAAAGPAKSSVAAIAAVKVTIRVIKGFLSPKGDEGAAP